jgi:hypothetical protein
MAQIGRDGPGALPFQMPIANLNESRNKAVLQQRSVLLKLRLSISFVVTSAVHIEENVVANLNELSFWGLSETGAGNRLLISIVSRHMQA